MSAGARGAKVFGANRQGAMTPREFEGWEQRVRLLCAVLARGVGGLLSGCTDGGHRTIRVSGLQWGRRSAATEWRIDRLSGLPRGYPLQWGRRSAATEWNIDASFILAPRALQWGRRSAATECVSQDWQMLADSFASMGPSLCCDGMLFGMAKLAVPLVASMGPSLCCDGMCAGCGH
mgnify:CR=1 FL=1